MPQAPVGKPASIGNLPLHFNVRCLLAFGQLAIGKREIRDRICVAVSGESTVLIFVLEFFPMYDSERSPY
jgi:hypothetical protein